MTGFARSEGSTPTHAWVWEVRSVNSRGLDIRLRLPPGFEALEPGVREAIGRMAARGSVAANLTVRRTEGGSEIRLNPRAVTVVAQAVDAMRAAIGAGQVNIDGLLALRGVLDMVEPTESEAETEARNAAMLESLRAALAGLDAARAGEGRRLAEVIAGQIDEVERRVAAVTALPARSVEAIGLRLKEQVERLSALVGTLDPGRLHLEAALLATKNDVAEELARLTAHVAAARDLLGAQEPVGRKLDFLTQEFNREANTLCSKSNDTDMTHHGLALKAVIDQMREQVQNIE